LNGNNIIISMSSMTNSIIAQKSKNIEHCWLTMKFLYGNMYLDKVSVQLILSASVWPIRVRWVVNNIYSLWDSLGLGYFFIKSIQPIWIIENLYDSCRYRVKRIPNKYNQISDSFRIVLIIYVYGRVTLCWAIWFIYFY